MKLCTYPAHDIARSTMVLYVLACLFVFPSTDSTSSVCRCQHAIKMGSYTVSRLSPPIAVLFFAWLPLRFHINMGAQRKVNRGNGIQMNRRAGKYGRSVFYCFFCSCVLFSSVLLHLYVHMWQIKPVGIKLTLACVPCPLYFDRTWWG